MGAARWQTAKCDRIPLQENMISQFDMKHWWKIWKQTLDPVTLYFTCGPRLETITSNLICHQKYGAISEH